MSRRDGSPTASSCASSTADRASRDAKEQIFAPFQRGGDAPAGRRASGLGLAVARGLTELMDGRVWAEDTPGGGLTLVVELPPTLRRSHPDQPAGTTSTSAPAGVRNGSQVSP